MTNGEDTGAGEPAQQPGQHQTFPTTLRDALTKAYFAGWYAHKDFPDRSLKDERIDQLLTYLDVDGDASITSPTEGPPRRRLDG